MRLHWRWAAVAGVSLLMGALFVGWTQWRVQVPVVPWHATEVQRPELWPLLVESPRRAQVDLALHWRGGALAGENWLQSQRRFRFDPWSVEHWAAREPTLYFVDPGGGGLELELELGRRDRAADGASLSPRLNGAELPTLDLPAGGGRKLIPLPREHLLRGINELRLLFDPSDSDRGIETRAERSARWLAVDRVGLRQVGVAPSSLDGRQLELRPGSVVRVPFAAATPALLRLQVEHAPPAAMLHVTALIGDRRRAVLHEEIADHGIVELVTPDEGFGRLELAVEAAPAARARILLDIDRSPSVVRRAGVPAKVQPDVYVYVIDTLRSDAVDLAGGPGSPTPHMARFAADAVVFERAWSPSSWTRPSTRALLDGVYPGTPPRRRDGSGWTLAEAMAASGYDTVAISQSFVVSRARFGAGFQRYYTGDALSRGRNEGHGASWFLWHHLAARGPSDRPLFAYLHTIDPHGPYTPYAEDRGGLPWWVAWQPLSYGPTVVERDGRAGDARSLEIMRRLYAGDIRHADRCFGAFLELLRFLGKYDGSVVILLADHGEAFGEHGEVGHGKTLHEEELRVPLMIKLPEMRAAGRRVRDAVSTVAVAPSILDALGISAPGHLAETSLLANEVGEWSLHAQLTRKARGGQPQREMRAVLNGDLKCIGTSTDGREMTIEAFDLDHDPHERTPLADPATGDRCRSLLVAGFASAPTLTDRPIVSDETRQRLEALGYVDQE